MISDKTWALRQEILRLLGGRCTCPCGCQDDNLRHLQLDHPDGGGTDERKRSRGQPAYAKLLADIKTLQAQGALDLTTYPLRPLCANCHFEKTMHGGCLTPRAKSAESNIYDLFEGENTPREEGPRHAPPVQRFAHLNPDNWSAYERRMAAGDRAGLSAAGVEPDGDLRGDRRGADGGDGPALGDEPPAAPRRPRAWQRLLGR